MVRLLLMGCLCLLSSCRQQVALVESWSFFEEGGLGDSCRATDNTCILCYEGNLLVKLGDDGHEVWRLELPAPAAGPDYTWGDMIPSNDGGAFLGSKDEAIHIGVDGTVVWHGNPDEDSPVSSFGSPLTQLSDGTLAFLLGSTLCWISDKGQLSGKVELRGYHGHRDPLVTDKGEIYYVECAELLAHPGSKVDLASTKTALVKLSREGKEVWRSQTGLYQAGLCLPAVDASGNAYATRRGFLDKYSADGKLLWSVGGKFSGMVTPSVSKEAVMCKDGDGMVAFSPDGMQLWEVKSKGFFMSSRKKDGYICTIDIYDPNIDLVRKAKRKLKPGEMPLYAQDAVLISPAGKVLARQRIGVDYVFWVRVLESWPKGHFLIQTRDGNVTAFEVKD